MEQDDVATQQAEDQLYAEGERPKLTEEGHVKKIKGITPLRRLCRGFGIDATGGRKELVERIINHLDLRPDYESLYAAENFTCKADLSRKGLIVAYLRFMCDKEGVPTKEMKDGKERNIKRPALEASLAVARSEAPGLLHEAH